MSYRKPSSFDTAEEAEPHQMRYRWVMLGLVWLLYAAFGVVSRSMAPLVTPVLRDLNISYSQMGLILGSWPLTYVAVALVSGAVIDRWGIHKSLFIGILIIGLSEVLRYFANGFVTMFLCVAMFGLGGPMISVGSPKTISQWFRGKERATAVGVYMTAPWTGSLIAYSITNSVVMPLTGYSWRLTFVVLSSLAFAAALLWWFLARDVERTEATERTGIAEVFTGLIDIRNVRRILLMGFLAFAVGHGFNDWLPKILETGGLSPAIACFAASIPLLIGIPTVLFLPRSVAPRLRGRIVSFLSLGIAIALGVVVTGSGSRLIGGLVFYGLCYSSVTPLLLLVLMDMPEVGSRYMGSAAGLYFCISEIGGFAGPFIVGAIKDLTGSFFAGAFFFVAVELAVAIMAFSLKIQPASDTKTS